MRITTEDFHTGGEPFRIVTGGVPEIMGKTILERREYSTHNVEVDRVRQLLCHEPRGHADMYGCFIIPPNDAGADFGVLFWHKDGYSTACGHGTIALGEWAVRTGRVQAHADGETDVIIDVPSGRVTARVRRVAGKTVDVTFRNVPSYVVAQNIGIETSLGRVVVDVSYGGAMYVSLDAALVGLKVDADHYSQLIAIGREIKWLLNDAPVAQHKSDPRLSGVYGTIIYEDLGKTATGIHQRNVTIFADGEVDRSPCGSGTSARIALLHAEGKLSENEVLTHDSIVNSRFLGRIVGTASADGFDAVIPEVSGNAYPTGEHTFIFEEDDEVGLGFVFR